MGLIVKEQYFDFIMLLERLHRLFLDVVKAELDRLKIADINNVQCFILYNVGHNKLTVGELTNRGYYLGSNVTYNLKKMVENGYLIQEPSIHDKRSSHVKLSKKGLKLYQTFEEMLDRHAQNLPHNNMTGSEIKTLTTNMKKFENFWSFMISRDLRF